MSNCKWLVSGCLTESSLKNKKRKEREKKKSYTVFIRWKLVVSGWIHWGIFFTLEVSFIRSVNRSRCVKRPRGFLCCSVCSAASSGSENCLRLRRLCGGGVKKKKEKKKKCLQRNVLKLCTVRSRRTRDQWAPCPISKKLVTPSFPGTRSTSAFCQSFPERCVQVCRVLRWCCCNCSRAYVLFLGQAPPPSPPPHFRPTYRHTRASDRLCLHQWFLCKRHKYTPLAGRQNKSTRHVLFPWQFRWKNP